MKPNGQRVAYRFLVSESAYRHLTEFDLKEFKKLKSAEDMRSYANIHAKFLGEGHTRTVYDIGGGKVLKLPLSTEYNYSNLKEADVSDCQPNSKVLAHVLDHDNYGEWLIMEKVKPVSYSLFARLLNKMLNLPKNLDFDNTPIQIQAEEATEIFDALNNQSDIKQITLDRVAWMNKNSSPWWEDLKKSMGPCNLPIDDLLWHNFGELRGNLVILDYGD